MLNKGFLRKAKLAGLTALLAGGALSGWMCTTADIQKNIVAGSLGYLKAGTTSFWNSFVPIDDVWAGLFDPSPTLFPTE